MKKLRQKVAPKKAIITTKKSQRKKKNINISSNFIFNKAIWVSLTIAFIISAVLFSVLFTLKYHNKITWSYPILSVLSLIPFVIFIAYWSIFMISFRLIFNAITKDIEKNSVFPFVSSFLIKEDEISIKKYLEKGNIKKIKGYKKEISKLVAYMTIILALFIIFNFLFVGLTQLEVIDVTSEWLYLFGLLANIISLILSAVFGFIVSNAINAASDFEAKYQGIKHKLYQFKIFLNVNDLSKIDFQSLRYHNINFLPVYFYQALLITNIHNQQYHQELENWKSYLALSSYYNQFSWLQYLYYFINQTKQLKIIKKTKYMAQLTNQIKKVHELLFSPKNNYSYFNNKFNQEELEKEYYALLNLLLKYNKRLGLKMITTALARNGLKIAQTINNKQSDNIIDERDVNLNLYQLNYLEYLFSIAFITK